MAENNCRRTRPSTAQPPSRVTHTAWALLAAALTGLLTAAGLVVAVRAGWRARERAARAPIDRLPRRPLRPMP